MRDHKTYVFRTYKHILIKLKSVSWQKNFGEGWTALYVNRDLGTLQKTQSDYKNDNVKSLEAEHRGGNGPKMGQSSTEDEEE